MLRTFHFPVATILHFKTFLRLYQNQPFFICISSLNNKVGNCILMKPAKNKSGLRATRHILERSCSTGSSLTNETIHHYQSGSIPTTPEGFPLTISITVRHWVRVLTKHKHYSDIRGLSYYFKAKKPTLLLKHHSHSQMRHKSPQNSMEISLQCQKLNYFNCLPNH